MIKWPLPFQDSKRRLWCGHGQAMTWHCPADRLDYLTSCHRCRVDGQKGLFLFSRFADQCCHPGWPVVLQPNCCLLMTEPCAAFNAVPWSQMVVHAFSPLCSISTWTMTSAAISSQSINSTASSVNDPPQSVDPTILTQQIQHIISVHDHILKSGNHQGKLQRIFQLFCVPIDWHFFW